MARKNNPNPSTPLQASTKALATHGATSSYDRRLMRRNMTTGRSVEVTHETAQPARRRPGSK